MRRRVYLIPKLPSADLCLPASLLKCSDKYKHVAVSFVVVQGHRNHVLCFYCIEYKVIIVEHTKRKKCSNRSCIYSVFYRHSDRNFRLID